MTRPVPDPIPGGAGRDEAAARRQVRDRTGAALITIGHLTLLVLAYATDLTLGLAATAALLIVVGLILGHG